MTDLIVNGVFAPDLEARTELPMSQAVFVARGGKLPRAKPKPVVRELKNGETVEGPGFRVENRIPGADANPYIAIATSLGLSGKVERLSIGDKGIHSAGARAPRTVEAML